MAELTDDKARIVALEKELATLTKAKETAEKEAETAAQVVDDLKTKLAEKQAGVVEIPTLTVGKDTYQFVDGDFTYKGKVVTLESLKEDSKLVAELIKEGVSHLRKVVK
jgi:hypothetical protein